uniref:DNA replication licensing factor MCM6-like n=1 Tax=Sinocyclocheilus rhinocerous TaxID=307959 RepID=A0A673KFE1_9TELE
PDQTLPLHTDNSILFHILLFTKHSIYDLVVGLYKLSNRTLWIGSRYEQSVARPRLQDNVLHGRALHCGHYALQTITKTESPKVTNTQKAPEPENKTNQQEKDEEEEEDNRPEYIPKRKAKNPLMKVGYAWMIGLPTGIIGFILAKRQVDKNRLKQLKIRQRMKKATEGDYESERYKPATRMQ